MIRAAEELHVTHGAVSRQVRSLETELGVRLFDGPKNSLSLTEAGVKLLSFLTSAFDQIEAGVDAVSDSKEGVLDVSCLGTFMMRWLIPRLQRFNESHPSIDVRFSASDADVDFSRDRFDVAIRVGQTPWPRSATVINLFPDYIGPVLSQELAAGLDLKTLADLLQLPILYSRSRPSAWSQWCDVAGLASEAVNGTMEYEHLYFMLEAAMSGLGVCVTPWSAVIDDISTGRLAAPFPFYPSGNHYVALIPVRPSQKATIFCQWLRTEARSWPGIPHSSSR
jgi:DNA-binding transcriptional LysR family regulator